MNISNLRKYSNGEMDEAALQASLSEDADISEYENDKAFMESATAMCMATVVQSMVLGEAAAEELDEDTEEAFRKVYNYMIGSGVITEAAAVSINNPKVNVVHLNKQAQISRLTTILTLKMARKADNKEYRKYKIGQKIKKENLDKMKKLYGNKAERLARKLWAQLSKNRKVAAVTEKPKKDDKK